MAGYSATSTRSTDALLVQVDQSGEQFAGTRTLGGSAGDCVCAVKSLGDGTIILVGYTSSFGEGSSDVCWPK